MKNIYDEILERVPRYIVYDGLDIQVGLELYNRFNQGFSKKIVNLDYITILIYGKSVNIILNTRLKGKDLWAKL